MLHKYVYEQFKAHFPYYAENVECYYPNGKNSVRVRLMDKYDFVFTYKGNGNWCFETVDSFIEHNLKGDN